MSRVRDDLSVAYVTNPKVASSAIRGAVAGRQADCIPHGYFVFSFIRHPWDRIVSALYSTNRSGAPLDERLAQYWERPEDMDVHVRPQARLLAGHRLDFLGRYERLTEDWKRLQAHVPLPDLTLSNVGKHRPACWQDAPLNFERWLPYYAGDFELCPEWSQLPER